MWTYQIRESNLDNGYPRIIVDFTNGTDKFERIYHPSDLDSLKQDIQAQLDSATANENLVLLVPKGVLDLTITDGIPK